MRLYHHPYSFNARRAVMTALHLKSPVELVYVDLQKGEQRQPKFLALNPNHKVPVLEDDGFILWESCAIMQYLADKTPRQTVYPAETRARADVNRWLFWSSQHFSPAIGILNWERVVKGMLGLGAADPAEVQRGALACRHRHRHSVGGDRPREASSGTPRQPAAVVRRHAVAGGLEEDRRLLISRAPDPGRGRCAGARRAALDRLGGRPGAHRPHRIGAVARRRRACWCTRGERSTRHASGRALTS
jgi:hypothetical protein